jgi:hypothetical protein
MQEADRGHTGIGSWDVMFPGSDESRLGVLAQLAATSNRSYVHWSTFLVAELDDGPVGTVAGYIPGVMTSDTFAAACREVLGADADAALAKDEAWSRSYFTVKMPADARVQGLTSACVATYIGNGPAIATYRRVGFEAFAECRHTDYERRFKTPGLVAFRRPLV